MLSKVHCNALVDNCIQNSHLGKYIIIPTGYMVETLVYTWQLSQQCKTTTMTNHKQCSSRLHFQHFIAEYTVPNSRCSPILHCRLKFASALENNLSYCMPSSVKVSSKKKINKKPSSKKQANAKLPFFLSF